MLDKKFFIVIVFTTFYLQPMRGQPFGGTKIATDLFEGDIKLKRKTSQAEPRGDILVQRNVVTDTSKQWDPSAIPYQLNTTTLNPAAVYAVLQAIKDYERLTCLHFVKRTTEQDYIFFYPANGCWSFVGKKGGKQMLSVGPGCESKGIVLHEICHALGFYHVQSRTDRDEYIRIEWQNIRQGALENFQKYDHGRIDQLGAPYDYGSIMLYGSTYFSRDGIQPTIVKLRPGGPRMGQRKALSANDVYQLNKFYRCTEYLQTTKIPQAVLPTSTSNPPMVTYSSGDCTFDDDTCLWENLADDQFNWTRHSGSTRSRMTGPSADHTTGSGHYMYIEASDPRVKGDTALLASGYYQGPLCLKFVFSMYGLRTGSLRVWVMQKSGNYSKMWEKTGNQGAGWKNASVDFPDKVFKIIVEGEVGAGWSGDIAIDDMQTFSDSCSGESTTEPTTRSTTRSMTRSTIKGKEMVPDHTLSAEEKSPTSYKMNVPSSPTHIYVSRSAVGGGSENMFNCSKIGILLRMLFSLSLLLAL